MKRILVTGGAGFIGHNHMLISNEFKSYLQSLNATIESTDFSKLELLIEEINQARLSDKFIFCFGNGGCAALSNHFEADLQKTAISEKGKPLLVKKRIKAISLSNQMPLISAWGNDSKYDDIFLQQLENLSSEGDLAIAFSGSGNSPNIIYALNWANSHNLRTWALLGYSDGGISAKVAQNSIIVNSNFILEIEDIFSIICHFITHSLKEKIKAETT